jgi:1,4-alpha-glucan branching enzyme
LRLKWGGCRGAESLESGAGERGNPERKPNKQSDYKMAFQEVQVIEEERDFLTDFDLHLFREGTHSRLYDKLGAHLGTQGGTAGAHFGVWAPNARRVYVLGDFNGWDRAANPLSQRGNSGVWAGFIPGVRAGSAYQFHIVSWHHGYRVDKADPMGFRQEGPPREASFVWDLSYEWGDREWMEARGQRNGLHSPLAIYEAHLESWMRVPEEGNRWLTFREVAPKLAEYVRNMGFTHVELLPVMEHPAFGPNDYEITGYFAPTSRLGAPQDLMFLIDELHRQGIGVILDWVPAHFPAGEHGLAYFDGTHLYEHGPWRVDVPKSGDGFSFDYSRPEVRGFLLSNACFWLDKYHADGLRVDAVESMLNLAYGRKAGEWVPNRYGGRENLEAIDFLRHLNTAVYRGFPDVQMIAEVRTDWPQVSRPTYAGGLGFGLKWDAGATDKVLGYFSHDPYFRKFHHQDLTFRGLYAFDENHVLPLSHEDPEHGKASLLARMPGDEWQRFANLRLLFGYVYLQPGKKLLFMGDEFGQWREWNREGSLDWHLAAYPMHAGVRQWVRDLNRLYRAERALHESDNSPVGFEWVDLNDAERSTLSWLRRDTQRREVLLAVCNFTPVVRRNVRIGVRRPGTWREVLNSDARDYGGGGQGNFGGTATAPFSSQGFPHTLTLTLPPLAMVVFKHEG